MDTLTEIGERRSLTDLSIRFDLNLDKFQLIKKRICVLGCDRCAVYASQCILILGNHVSAARLCTRDISEFD